MAKRPGKVIVDAHGKVFLRRASGHHNRIGSIEKTSSGWKGCASVPSSPSGLPYCSSFKTKHRAVLHIVKHWSTWIGLPPGHTSY